MKKVLSVVVVLLFVIGTIPAFANCGSCAKSGKGFFQNMSDGVKCIGKCSSSTKDSSLRTKTAPAKSKGTALTPKNVKKVETAAPAK